MQGESIKHVGERPANGDWFFHEEIPLLFELQRLIFQFFYMFLFSHFFLGCILTFFNFSFIVVESITRAGSGKAMVLCNSCLGVKESQNGSTEVADGTKVADASDRYVFLVYYCSILFRIKLVLNQE